MVSNIGKKKKKKKVNNQVVLPIEITIRILIFSEDVLHS